MVMPLYDHSPFRWPTPPYVMWSLIVINVIVFFVQSRSARNRRRIRSITRRVSSRRRSRPANGVRGPIPAPLTLITAMFVHANFMHVFGNMIFLFVFGDDIEEALGHWRFLVFYLACGIGADARLRAERSEFEHRSDRGVRRRCRRHLRLFAVPAVRQGYGAARAHTAAGAGLLGDRPLGDLADRAKSATGAQDGVAYWAHIGGLITGAVLFVVMRPAGHPAV